ncbi:unnamed protein product [Candidula unifasciata]|uniref:Major facilitator superfamily (MFS) profile domain-containing protein n=1 Tax=Candidula unifasciata TaxID=100452 RepID=A0A8S3ZA41_9EUPU|nr:unnamed protein product [Candidula unifasciata]
MSAPEHKMDHGWAWVVLAGSFMSLFLICFLTASAGIIQVEMVEDLGVGAGPVSLMTSFALGLASLLGSWMFCFPEVPSPLSGILASLLSARVTVFLGSALMSLGMLATSLSYSVSAMMFFYGFVTGLGFGIAYSPMVVITSFYFEKYRMLANGVILCASGVGMLSLPLFERYLIDSHGWRFAFAFNGAIMLHILVFAAVFFPTEIEKRSMIQFSFSSLWKRKARNEKTALEKHRNNNTVDGSCEPERVFVSCHQITNGGVQLKTLELIRKSALLVDSSSVQSKSQNGSVCGNETDSNIFVSAAKLDGDKSVQPLLDNSQLTLATEAAFKCGLLSEDKESGVFHASPFRSRTLSELSARSAGSTVTQTSTRGCVHPKETYTFGQLRKDCSGGRSYLGSSFGWASSDLGSSLMLPVKIEEMISGDIEQKSSLWRQIIRICRHRAVWILSVNSLFFLGGFAIHAVHFPAFAESKGMSRAEVASFYIVFGTLLMIGRLGGGWLFNKLKPPLCVLMFVLQSVNGVSMALAPFYATNPVGIYVMQASFGLLYGQSYMVLPAVLAEIMGVQDLTIAFGIIHLFMGLGYIIAPAIAGFMYDATGTYDIPYYMGGSLYLLGALSLLLMIFVKREADTGHMVNDMQQHTEQRPDGDEEQITTPLVASHSSRPVAESGAQNTKPAAEEEKLCF